MVIFYYNYIVVDLEFSIFLYILKLRRGLINSIKKYKNYKKQKL